MNELNFLYNQIVTAKSPEHVFGVVSDEKQLKQIFRTLMRKVHPDNYSSDAKETYMATEASQELNKFFSEAKQKISNNTYGTSSFSSKSTSTNSSTSEVASTPRTVEKTFSVGGYEYKIFSDSIEGDFCNVYFGERSNASGLEEIVLKVPQDPSDNDLIENEYCVTDVVKHKSMPVLIDRLNLDGKQTNVFRKIENCYDLYSLKEKFPNGLPQEHAVWILDRLLSVVGFLHTNLVVHGAIEPGNVLVTLHNHNAILADYLLAIPSANEDGAKYVAVNDYSAPELEAGAKPHPASDIYSLGKTMVYLMGGDVDTCELHSSVDYRVSDFIQKMVHDNREDRVSDAWECWHELKTLRKEVFGAESQFLELKIN